MNRIQKFLDVTLTALIVSITPFTASVIPVIFLYVNLTGIMLLPWYFAVPIALAAEAIGVGSVSIYFKARLHNGRYKDSKNHVFTWPAISAYVIYLSAIITTNALLESPGWYQASAALLSISKALLSLLSLSGAFLVATNYAINVVIEKNQRTSKAKPAVSDGQELVNLTITENQADNAGQEADTLPVFMVSNKNDLTAEMVTHLQNGHDPVTLKTMFPKVSHRTIRRWKKDLV